jgi:hypothetical protein
LKSLLAVRDIFKGSECRYLLNKLYIDDYCVWIQQFADSRLATFTRTLDEAVARLFDPANTNDAGIPATLQGRHTAAKELTGWGLCGLEGEALTHGMHMIGDEEENCDEESSDLNHAARIVEVEGGESSEGESSEEESDEESSEEESEGESSEEESDEEGSEICSTSKQSVSDVEEIARMLGSAAIEPAGASSDGHAVVQQTEMLAMQKELADMKLKESTEGGGVAAP